MNSPLGSPPLCATVSISPNPSSCLFHSVNLIGIDDLSNEPCLVVPRLLFNFLMAISFFNLLSRVLLDISFSWFLILSVLSASLYLALVTLASSFLVV